MRKPNIEILVNDFELSKEGFGKGSKVNAEIDSRGVASFGNCFVYPQEYKLLKL